MKTKDILGFISVTLGLVAVLFSLYMFNGQVHTTYAAILCTAGFIATAYGMPLFFLDGDLT